MKRRWKELETQETSTMLRYKGKIVSARTISNPMVMELKYTGHNTERLDKEIREALEQGYMPESANAFSVGNEYIHRGRRFIAIQAYRTK